jgi:hypothetical protein
VPTLCRWMVSFLSEVLPYKPVDVQHVQKLLEDGLTQSVILVAEVEGEIRGTVIGVYHKHPLNPSISVLTEIAWWVPQEHRKTRIGWVLLQAFASLKKTDLTTLSLLPDSGVAHRHLNKLGFTQSEVAFVKDNRS